MNLAAEETINLATGVLPVSGWVLAESRSRARYQGRAAGSVGLAALLLSVVGCFRSPGAEFDFTAELFGSPSRIDASVMAQDVNTGYVQISGVAIGLAAQPLWDFGDGTIVGSWFPAEHTYALPRSNYLVRVTGYFTDGATNSTEVLVRFVPSVVSPVALPEELKVTIPTHDVSLISRMAGSTPVSAASPTPFRPTTSTGTDSPTLPNIWPAPIRRIATRPCVLRPSPAKAMTCG
jgi:hypothetical protein